MFLCVVVCFRVFWDVLLFNIKKIMFVPKTIYLFFTPLSHPFHSSTFYDFHKHAFLDIFSIFLSLDSDERNLLRPNFAWVR